MEIGSSRTWLMVTGGDLRKLGARKGELATPPEGPWEERAAGQRLLKPGEGGPAPGKHDHECMILGERPPQYQENVVKTKFLYAEK